MIKPISSALPSFRAIYNAKDYMQPAQIKVADRINYMLTSDEFRNAEGKTLEEQAGVKADIFINQPIKPYKSELDERTVDVTLVFARHIDAGGEKFGRRSVYDVGSFNSDNVETFPDEFRKTNEQNNFEKVENRINLAATIMSGLTMLGIMLSKVLMK